MSIEERYLFVPSRGESWQQMEKRLMSVLNKIVGQPYKIVAIVTHAGAMRSLMPVLKNESREVSFNYDFGNGSVTIFNYENGSWCSVRENDLSHFAGRIT